MVKKELWASLSLYSFFVLGMKKIVVPDSHFKSLLSFCCYTMSAMWKKGNFLSHRRYLKITERQKWLAVCEWVTSIFSISINFVRLELTILLYKDYLLVSLIRYENVSASLVSIASQPDSDPSVIYLFSPRPLWLICFLFIGKYSLIICKNKFDWSWIKMLISKW